MIRRDPRERIRTQSELARMWQRRVRRNGSSVGTTCRFVFADGRVTRRAVTIADLDGPLDAVLQRSFARWIRDVLDHDTAGWSIAILITRPGVPDLQTRDLAWASSLYAAARIAGVACEVVHVAVGDLVRPVPLDALPSHAFGC